MSLVSVFAEPKVDCHVHVFDPVRFPYRADTHYRPAGAELATAQHLTQLMDAYGVRYALLVGPTSGYGLDNRCMLDAISRGGGRFKGVAVVANDASDAELRALKAAGAVGVSWNAPSHGVEHFATAAPLLERLADLDLFLDLQVEYDQLVAMLPLLERSRVRIVVDHCGRPNPDAGVDQPGFRALCALGATGRAHVKLSSLTKFSHEPPPHDDAMRFIDALVSAFTLDRCLWASDWPFLRAPMRIDYGVLLAIAQRWFPDPAQRRKLFWDNPKALFGF
jgi:predicted TIM-barrel fold metal-dependent hydrolase